MAVSLRGKFGSVNIRKKAEILKAEIEKRKAEIDEKPSRGGSKKFYTQALCILSPPQPPNPQWRFPGRTSR
jgi:hypothetical protein